MPDLAEKDHYHELTDKQQAAADAYVADPEADNTVLAERAGVARSTVYNVKEHYDHILEAQLNRRGRHDGEETAEGDPFEGQLEITTGAQLIQDRPEQPDADECESDDVAVEATESEPEPTHDADGRVTVDFDKQDVRDILAGNAPERVRGAVVEAVVSKAFGERQEA